MAKRKEIDINFDYSKVRGSTELHEEFKAKFIVQASRTFPNVFVIPYDVFVARAYSQPDKIVRAGQVGVMDILVFGDGWYRLLDTKTGKNKLQENQMAVKERLDEISGKEVCFKINSIKQGLDIISEAMDG